MGFEVLTIALAGILLGARERARSFRLPTESVALTGIAILGLTTLSLTTDSARHGMDAHSHDGDVAAADGHHHGDDAVAASSEPPCDLDFNTASYYDEAELAGLMGSDHGDHAAGHDDGGGHSADA